MELSCSMQFDAFAYPAFQQIVSDVAKMHDRTKGTVKLPMVIRVPYAGGIGGVMRKDVEAVISTPVVEASPVVEPVETQGS
ncbi:UNVERIFIED_ORG: pyruvate/2-oxoglutarate/acetoin dehydrogenase E1 component [Arthrobacter sp. UYEF10]